MLVSTGAAEVVLFLLAIPMGLPMPLLPVQLLWLNLVINGIQDVTLAVEKGEGDELSYPPRRPMEPIFDRVMLRRILHPALVMGSAALPPSTGCCTLAIRRRKRAICCCSCSCCSRTSRPQQPLRASFDRPPALLRQSFPGADGHPQFVHIGAMHVPALSEILHVAPVSRGEWALLLLAVSGLLLVMELEKCWD